MDSRDFYTLAEKLCEQENNEAALRSAVSRAYYAAFLACRDKIIPEIVFPEACGKGKGSHEQVFLKLKSTITIIGVESISQEMREDFIRLGGTLSATREFRRDADYELDEPYYPDNVNAAMKDSKKILNMVDNLVSAIRNIKTRD
ncbi:MAG: hypothetical protein HQL69_24070 [Magnetococcales bacterium]|nr:hypothetical protein [Magnetococcales bacterium]